MKKIIIIFLLIFGPINIIGQDAEIKYKRLNINNISTIFGNNGLSDTRPYSNIEFHYPKDDPYYGEFYYSGFLWGGRINGNIRVSGTTFHSSLQPGGDKQIYRIRPDWQSGDISSEIFDEEGTENEIREEYKENWYNWPGNNGAPFNDLNNNGVYEPDIDIPGIQGADQTIWFVANDYDSMLVDSIFYSKPLGIELEATYWAYNQEPPLGNVIFRKYRITNMSSHSIEDMYCSITTDPDIGDVTNDYVGCDTLLSLAYGYNWDDDDIVLGNITPAVGYVLLKGPSVNGENIGLSSFNFIINADPIYGYPEGAAEFYNQFRGLLNSGSGYYEIPLEFGGGYTTFPFSGDPIDESGWRDGFIHPPGNRNMNLSTGPFNLKPSESQEIVFAQLVAGGYNNISRLAAIDSLKKHSYEIKQFFNSQYDNIVSVNIHRQVNIKSYELFQNYPNPFNPSTTIKYSVSEVSNVSLTIYDIMGREIRTFENIGISAGQHSTTWDGTNNNGVRVSSGVYIYKLRAVSLSGNGKVFEKASKLMLVK